MREEVGAEYERGLTLAKQRSAGSVIARLKGRDRGGMDCVSAHGGVKVGGLCNFLRKATSLLNLVNQKTRAWGQIRGTDALDCGYEEG